MTPESQGAGSEETPTPPVHTRWTEGQEGAESELMPPYIPGRRIAPEEPPADAAADGGDAPWSEQEPAPREEAAELEPEPLPSWGGDEVEPTAEPEPADSVGSSFPFDMPMGETAEPAASEPAAPEPYGGFGQDEGPESGWGVDDTAETAADAFPELEPEPAPEAAWPAGAYFPPEPASPEGGEAPELGVGAERDGPPTAAEELAGRLEALAARLRSEGRDAVERELASDDRFASLLAGILSGYLAARDG